MNTRLKIKVAKKPSEDAMLSARSIHADKRLLRRIFGTSKPNQHIAVLIPGTKTDALEVSLARESDDDLMALARVLYPERYNETTATDTSVNGGERA